MALATAEAIRDRLYTLIESLTPTSLSGDKFRRHRNELGADFDAWAEANAAGALRRFQVREVDVDAVPEYSSGVEERVRLRAIVRVAYPQNHRYGSANAMDRDDVMNQDWLKINYAIGIYGRGNFSSTNDCTPMGCSKEFDRGGKVDYLVITADYQYVRALS